MGLSDAGVCNLPALEKISGMTVDSADFINGEYNSLIFNSLYGFPYSYYQMYIPNISFGHFGCSN